MGVRYTYGFDTLVFMLQSNGIRRPARPSRPSMYIAWFWHEESFEQDEIQFPEERHQNLTYHCTEIDACECGYLAAGLMMN